MKEFIESIGEAEANPDVKASLFGGREVLLSRG